MTYIDKRALATKKSPTSLIPYVNLDDVINKIISKKVISLFSQPISIDQTLFGSIYNSLTGSVTEQLAYSQMPLPACTIKKFGIFIPSGGNTLNTDIVEVQLIVDEVAVASLVIPTDGLEGFIYSENLNIVITENQLVNYTFIISEGTGACTISGCRLDYSN